MIVGLDAADVVVDVQPKGSAELYSVLDSYFKAVLARDYRLYRLFNALLKFS